MPEISDKRTVTHFTQHNKAQVRLNGLVLAGGQSTRMGVDKGRINWHGVEQRYYLAELLAGYCNKVYISCRDAAQASEIQAPYKFITDCYTGVGAIGAILSAFDFDAGSAWLVLACDLALLDQQTVSYLIKNRDENALATSYLDRSGFPEPLCTIWEPGSFTGLLQAYSINQYGPSKFLKNNDVKFLTAPHPGLLANINTQEEAEKIWNCKGETRF